MWASETASEPREKHERKICCVFLIIIEKKTQTARWVDSMLVFNMIARFSWFLTRHSDAFSILSSPKNIYDMSEIPHTSADWWQNYLLIQLTTWWSNNSHSWEDFPSSFHAVCRCCQVIWPSVFRRPDTGHRQQNEISKSRKNSGWNLTFDVMMDLPYFTLIFTQISIFFEFQTTQKLTIDNDE